MGLTDYAVQRDKFHAEEVTNGFGFPCGVCTHRHGTHFDEPCRTCDHNVLSVPDDEPDSKTPMERLYGCCADEVPNAPGKPTAANESNEG